jgi:polyvinyl alcohol dehydrogenase (cytochrome)
MRRKKNRREFLTHAGTAVAATTLLPSIRGQGRMRPVPGPADWPRFASDLHNTRFNSLENTINPGNVGRLRLKWRHEVGAPIQTTPAVVGDSLFIGAWDGNYHALDTETGELKWKFDAGIQAEPRWGLRDLRSSAQYVDGKIYFGTGEGELHSVDATTGRTIWKTQVDTDPMARISSSPNVHGERIFIGTSGDRSKIACVDRETGAVRWRFQIVPTRDDAGGAVWTSAAVDEEQNIVYNVTGNPRTFTPPGPLLYTDSIIANDLETGELLWYYQVRATDPFDLDFSCHPMLFEAVSPGKRGARRQCVGAGNKTAFFTWDRYTGELLWRVMLTNRWSQGGPWMNSTATAYNKVYLVSNAINEADYQRDPVTGRNAGLSQSVTAALQAYTGEIVWWRHNDSLNRSPVCVANGVFYQSLGDGSLEAYHAETGQQLWQSSMPSPSRGGIVIANGTLYTSNGEGGLPTEPRNPYSVFAYSIDGR